VVLKEKFEVEVNHQLGGQVVEEESVEAFGEVLEAERGRRARHLLRLYPIKLLFKNKASLILHFQVLQLMTFKRQSPLRHLPTTFFSLVCQHKDQRRSMAMPQEPWLDYEQQL
jgi:hypothetical protein